MSSCVFCAIAEGTAPAARVYENDDVVAFLDIRPIARGHTLVVPRTHAPRLEDLDPAHSAAMFRTGQRLARALARSDLAPDGTHLVLNDGRAAFQTVFHSHLHVLPRWRGDRLRVGLGLVRRRPHDPEATAAAIRAGLDRLATEEHS
ncbi:HIT family protein [Rhodococcus chondri]|uniref:HIT family protein n=1 Tax=Rhodococcus chondri TaxID=3065941 RepID=A0ABU7JV11_9NOCA|nr:HIT family protein [Rhodococcus sp. CC-R104]MEE2033855.1 HIT family protein [Rhodococcus sp. CC-R104]